MLKSLLHEAGGHKNTNNSVTKRRRGNEEAKQNTRTKQFASGVECNPLDGIGVALECFLKLAALIVPDLRREGSPAEVCTDGKSVASGSCVGVGWHHPHDRGCVRVCTFIVASSEADAASVYTG